jgi:eukaryotic-like serine/threonine-protein kinase
MPADRDRISDLYHRALTRAPAERRAFLEHACGGDQTLRAEVESLLGYDAPSFLETPAAHLIAGGTGTHMVNRQLGPYTILAPLGAGGMGEVYRARDSKLGRDVAIKILPPYVMADAERRARFAREARVLATLNHPNIGAIYGLEEFDGMTALVLELVEGMTLADRLERGPLSLSQSLGIARQIVEALDAAHEKGIVHRDLKPANIILQGATDLRSDDVRAKLLDFGLAKPLARDLHDGPTISIGDTGDGRVMGTPGYMSPEQARGQSVDARTDVWAFGCVLYEMMTGRQAFGGATTSDTIAKILERDPDWQALPPATPPGIRKLLNRCLEKDPRRRLHAIADATFEIDEVLAGGKAPVETAALTRVPTMGWLIAAVFGVLAVTAGAWALWSGSAKLPPARVMPLTSYPGIESSPTFSPDGKQLAFSWNGDKGDNEDIYVVIVGADTPLRITTDVARDVSPAWRSDGNQIAFARMESDRASIYLVSPHGGSERKLADFLAIPPGGGQPIESWDPKLSWSPDGRWLAVSGATSGPEGGVFLVGEDGSKRTLLPAKGGSDYRMAVFSPKGDAIALVNRGFIEVVGISATNSPTLNGALRRVTSFLGAVLGLTWTADGGSLLFGRARFTSPDPPYLWRMPASGDRPPERIDLAGVAAFPAVSASESRLAFVRRGLNEDLFKLQEGRPPEPLLASTSNEQDASFSNDGSKIAFASDRGGEGSEVWIAEADGSNRRSVTKGAHKPEGSPRWSPDDRRLVFDGEGQDGLRHIYVVDAAGGSIQAIGSRAGANDQLPSWSHDGKWVYFGSNRSGRYEVWRAPAGGEDPHQVTTSGGEVPYESSDGRTLFHLRLIDGVRTVFSMPLAGGPPRSLGIAVNLWNYLPVKRGLYYMSVRQGQRAPYTFDVRFLDFSSKQSRTLYSARLASASPGISATPDGKAVLIAGVAEITQDLMRIENFR